MNHDTPTPATFYLSAHSRSYSQACSSRLGNLHTLTTGCHEEVMLMTGNGPDGPHDGGGNWRVLLQLLATALTVLLLCLQIGIALSHVL